jgi:hypothetical protein
MTRWTVPAAGTGRRSKTQVPAGWIPAGRRPRTVSGGRSPLSTCPPAQLPYAAAAFIDRRPAPHGPNSRRPPLARCTLPASGGPPPVYRTCEMRALRARMLMRQTGMFTRSVDGCPWSGEVSRLGSLTVNPGLPSLACSRPLRGSLRARRRSGGCVISAGPVIRYPRVAACEQYQVPGGDDAGEVDEELEG